MVGPDDRVPIWNTFFKLAWEGAKALHEVTTGSPSSSTFDPWGGTLPPGEREILATVVLCTLAIEARANHLIEELAESGMLGKETAKAARRLPTKEKWFLIPALARSSTQLDSGSGPHQAIAQVCDLRNDFLHVDYAGVRTRLPAAGTMLSYFQRIVEAFEDMNVVLNRVSVPRTEVLRLGRFV